jgi:hypothetical protein
VNPVLTTRGAPQGAGHVKDVGEVYGGN